MHAYPMREQPQGARPVVPAAYLYDAPVWDVALVATQRLCVSAPHAVSASDGLLNPQGGQGTFGEALDIRGGFWGD